MNTYNQSEASRISKVNESRSVIESMNRYSAPRIASYIKGLNVKKKELEAFTTYKCQTVEVQDLADSILRRTRRFEGEETDGSSYANILNNKGRNNLNNNNNGDDENVVTGPINNKKSDNRNADREIQSYNKKAYSKNNN